MPISTWADSSCGSRAGSSSSSPSRSSSSAGKAQAPTTWPWRPSRRPMAGTPPRGWAWAAIVALFLLMTMGNVVSATGSGLGCPDWPLCHGRLLPPAETQVLIEFSHRLKAIPFTLLLLVTVVLTWRRTTARAPRRLSLVLVALLAAQIGLGGVTVLFKLPGLVSTAHLVNALLILAG